MIIVTDKSKSTHFKGKQIDKMINIILGLGEQSQLCSDTDLLCVCGDVFL